MAFTDYVSYKWEPSVELREELLKSKSVERFGKIGHLLSFDIADGNYTYLLREGLWIPNDNLVLFDLIEFPDKKNLTSLHVSKGINSFYKWDKIESVTTDGKVIKAIGSLYLEPNITIDGIVFTYNIVSGSIEKLIGKVNRVFDDFKIELSALNTVNEYPSKLKVELTQLCNLQCTYCTNPTLPNKSSSNLEKIKNYTSELDFNKVINVSFTGLGETLISKDFWEVLDYVSKKKVHSSLITNGMLIEKNLDRLINSNLGSIAITIDSLDAGRFESIRKRSSLERIKKGVTLLKKRINEIGSSLDVNIICPIIPSRVQDSIDVLNFAFHNGLPAPKFYPLYSFDGCKVDNSKLNSCFEVLKERIIALYGKKIKYLCREDYLINNDEIFQSCKETNSTILIRADGTFDICNERIFQTTGLTSTGSVLGDWKSSQFDLIRYRHFKGIPTGPCSSCNVYKIREIL